MTSTSGSNTTKIASRKPGRPRRSIKDIANAPKPGDAAGKARRKPYRGRTSWRVHETKEFIRLLVVHRASRGCAIYPDVTYAKISKELNDKFPDQRVPKTAFSCRSKHMNLRVEFHLVALIRSASSGLDYDDTRGVVVYEHTHQAWNNFCEAHPSVVKFEGYPWPHWNDFRQLMPATSNGSRALQDRPSTAPGAEMPMISAGRDLNSVFTSMAPDPATPTIFAPADPNSIAPSSPSVYLSRLAHSDAASAAVTSVSQTRRKRDDAKKMLEQILSVVTDKPMPKEDLPACTSAEAELTGQVQVMPPVVLATVASTSAPAPIYEYIERAAGALNEFELGPTDLNDVADYMSDVRNRHRVMFFLRFSKEARRVWINNTLEEVRERKKRLGRG